MLPDLREKVTGTTSPKFVRHDYHQTSMVVINYLEQLQTGTFEPALYYLISDKLKVKVEPAKKLEGKSSFAANDNPPLSSSRLRV